MLHKLFESWRGYINEGLHDILFHMTNIYKLDNILRTNRFMTSVAKGIKSDEEGNKGKFYYFSTARSPMGKFMRTVGNGYALLVLNGQKLSHNYKGTPVDYWGREFIDSDEMEDRIITDKPYIDNAMKYIEEVGIIFLDVEKEYSDIRSTDIDKLKNIENFLNKSNIPLFIYVNKNAWRKRNKSKSLKSVKEFIQYIKEKNKDIKQIEPYSSDRISYATKEIRAVSDILKAIVQKNDKNLDEEARDFIYYIKYYERDAIVKIKNLIHNAKTEPGAREYIHNIFSFMRKKKITKFEELIAYMSTYVKKYDFKSK